MIGLELQTHADPEKAKHLQRFFKTGPGEYAEGDLFLGISVPVLRKIAKKNISFSLQQIRPLIKSSFHEERALALYILVLQFERAEPKAQKRIFDFYIKHRRFINNWDLVDVTAPQIVGSSLFEAKRDLLYKFSRSKGLWERRIAIISTFFFIRKGDFADTLRIARTLLNDPHDLIHKAVGWMLREMGKRDEALLEKFLKEHSAHMPRTMLRYAIERFPEKKRKRYLDRSTK